MRQTFHQKSDPAKGPERLARLRTYLAEQGVDGFLIPRADEFQGEYVAPHAERLAWLTGFTGSAGTAAVLPGRAAVFVDGRYTVQVRQQTDDSVFEAVDIADKTLEDWLTSHLAKGQKLAYDMWLHTPAQVAKLKAACDKAGAELVAFDRNAVDAVWEDRPAPPQAPARPYDVKYAGKTSEEKRSEVGAFLKSIRQDAAVITQPESIAWLLNIRGGDVAHVPAPQSFLIAHRDGHCELFIDTAKLNDDVRRHLGNHVSVYAVEDLGARLDDLGKEKKLVLIDGDSAPAWVDMRLRKAKANVSLGDDPCMMPKACKTPAELRGARNAHLYDGAAMSRFLFWISRNGPSGNLDEITAVRQLEKFREETGRLEDISFETISAAGPNAALPHYRVTEASNRRVENNSIYLVDSGGQYLEGTTDITRTVAIGTPSAEMRDRFTRVLKGMISLTLARFPKGTLGIQLDTFARQPLWEVGCNYDHGTGHGVGAYLSVHEGPASISPKLKNVALRPGMIFSNEPGYYKVGAYGIRIENLVYVTEPETMEGGDRPMMAFETLTLAPIDRTLIIPDLLTEREREWLNAYHDRVAQEIGPLVDEKTRTWLEEATQPV